MPRSKPPRRRLAGRLAGRVRGLDPFCEEKLELAEERMELAGRLLHLAEDVLCTGSFEDIERVRMEAVRRIMKIGPSSQFDDNSSVKNATHHLFDYPVLSRLAVTKTPALELTGTDCWALYASAPQDAFDTMPKHEAFFHLLLAEDMDEAGIASELRKRWDFR